MIHPPQLLIATENKGKRRELQQLLADLPVELVLPSEVGLTLKVEETGSTYAENAALKASAYAQACGLIALADDSGLEVDALGGAPGLYSARYGSALLPSPARSTPLGLHEGQGPLSDADRRVYLVQNLRDMPRPWIAHFHATVAVATPEGEIRFADGECPGEIIPEERGTGGFGYDPIFLLDGSTQTMAELDDDERNRLSHRGRAVRAAISILKEILGVT
jgi:XTP/dITP diphosphohydrolase